MLSAERKRIRNNGIIIDKLLYWDIELVNHIGKDVVIRYDLGDARWILVYDTNDKYLCQAELRRTQHPMIQLAEDQPTSFKELRKEYTEIKKLQRNTERKTKILVRQTQIVVDRLMIPMRKAKALDANPIFKQPAMIEPPKQSRDQAINAMEKQMVKSLPKLEPIRADEPIHKTEAIVPIPIQPSLDDNDLTIKPKPKSFEEMLKRAGIR